MQENGAGLENADRLGSAAVHQRWNLRVRVDLDEAASELIPLIDPDEPGVVFRALVPELQQLLEHHGDLHPVRRGQRVELQWMAPDRQFLVVGWPGDRSIDV